MTLLVVFMWICKYMMTLGRNDSPITVFARVTPPPTPHIRPLSSLRGSGAIEAIHLTVKKQNNAESLKFTQIFL